MSDAEPTATEPGRPRRADPTVGSAPGKQPAPAGGAANAAKDVAVQGGKKAATEGAKGAVRGAQRGGAKGAQIGAKAGSVLPVAGTAIGSALGGAAGAGAGAVGGGAAGSAKGGLSAAADRSGRVAGRRATTAAKPSRLTRPEPGEPSEGPPPVDGVEKAATAGLKGAGAGALKGLATGNPAGSLAGALRGGAKGARGAKDGGKKNRWMLAAAAVPVLAVAVAMSMLVTIFGSMVGEGDTNQAAAAAASTRAGVPPGVLGVYRQAGADSRVPWELLASIADETTSNGTEAPDGKERSLPMSPEEAEFVVAAATAGETEASDTVAAATTAADNEASGSVVPVADPPIVVESDGGPWVGVFLVNEAAWGTDGTGDPQRLEDQAEFVGAVLASTVGRDENYEAGGGFEKNRDPWIGSVVDLPIKGLSGGGDAQAAATRIVERAIAWSNGEDWCSGTGPGGGGAVGLPTAGPIKIGDRLQFGLYGPLVFTAKAWGYSIPIVQEARRRGLSDRAAVIALGTSIVETGGMKMYANSNVPASLALPHDAVGSDHDSVGLFQQRQTWGPTATLMNPALSAGLFYDALVRVPNWESIDLGVAAQKVQISAQPDRYLPAMVDGVAILATVDASGLGGKVGSTTETGTTTTTAAEGGATTTVPPPTAATASPTKVLVVGDSLTVGADGSGELPATWTVDAEVGRTTAQGIEVLEATDIATFDAVIVALGANDYSSSEATFSSQIATVMTLVGDSKPVWWVNVDIGSAALAAASEGPNKALGAAVTTYPNLKLGDWNAAAASTITEGMRAGDKTHYTAAGYVIYGKFLAALPTGTAAAVPAPGCTSGNGTIIDIDTGAPIAVCPVQNALTNCEVVDEINAMIAAASADGLTLTIGNSYRDPAQQIQLRKEHCGTSHYAIYEAPSSSCRPPTARPGTSQHEKGLAIDFAYCSSRSTACWQWLNLNAAKFGFYPFNVEPWHWSTTGK